MTNLNFDWQHLYRSYLKYVKKDSRVIEVGASNISRTRQLARHCQNLTGVEFYPQRIPKNYKNIKYIQADWQKLDQTFRNQKFDILISSHTIEHVPEDLRAINQTYKILKPNGIAIFNTPNRKRLVRTIIEIFTGPKQFPSQEHIREYDYSNLIKLLNQSKFKNNYVITPIVFGIHSSIRIYLKRVPKLFKSHCNYWQVTLHK